jgi:sigma-E factor negative regulatory protein RseC
MLIEQGVVKKVTGREARVATQRSSTCGSCASRGACHALGGSNEAEITAMNRADAKVGDVVELVLPEGALLWASVVAYLVPVILLLVGAVIGHMYHGDLSMGSDGASALGSVVGLGVGLAFTWVASRHARRTGYTMPVIERVVEKADRPEGLARGPEPEALGQ